MADEIIDIAKFDFDTSLLEKSMAELQSKMFELKKAQEEQNKTYRDAQKEINTLKKAQELLKNSSQDNSKAYQENEARIKQLTEAQKQSYIANQNTANQLAVVRREYDTTAKALQVTIDKQAEQISYNDAITAALDREINSINAAKQNNKELRAIRDQLNPTIEAEAAVIAKLNERINANTQFMTANGDATEQRIAGIGKYKEQIIEAYKEIEKEKKALEELNDELAVQLEQTDKNSEEYKILNQQINQNIIQINNYNSSLADMRGEQDNVNAGLELMQGGFLGFIQRAKEAGGAAPLLTGTFNAIKTGLIGATKAGLAFLATPIGMAIGALAAVIGIVVGAFKFMAASMNSTEEGSQKLAKVTGAITGVFNGLWKIIKPLGEYLGGAFIAAFEFVGEAISKVVDSIAAALEFLGFDEAAEGLRNMKAEVEASSKAAADLAAAEGELDKAQRKSKTTQLEYQKQAEKLRQQRDDESKSISERIALNEQLGEKLKQQLADELAIAEQALKVANLRIKAEGKTKEALDAQAEAVANIREIEERITSQESEQLSNLNSLRKEAADAERERQEKAAAARQKILDDTIKAMEIELEYYLASQGDKKKSMQDELKIAKEVADRKQKIAEAQFNASKKTELDKRAFELETLNISNEFAERQTELAIENAETELELFKLNNQSKIEGGQLLNDELFKQEQDRMKRVYEEELKVLGQRLLSQEEYNLEKKKIDDAFQQEKDALNAEKEQTEKAKQALDLENERIAQGVNFEYDLEAQLQQYEAERELQREAALKAGADMVAFDEATAKQRKAIEKDVQSNKLQLYSDAFKGIASILGESTAAGKAAAVAQATIDTYQAANAALSAYPPPFSYVAMGLAIATGIKNVKEIMKVNPKGSSPKYAKGGLMEVGGSRHYAGGTSFIGSDGTQFEAERGEMIGVLNRNAARGFMSFNNSFLNGGLSPSSSSVTQNELSTKADNTQMAQLIAEAVRLGARDGAREGSSEGMVGLANNREFLSKTTV